MTMNRIVDAPQWGELEIAATRINGTSAQQLTGEDGRWETMSAWAGPIHVDWSRHMVDSDVLALLEGLCEWRGLEGAISDMFAGAPINTTERRRVLHTALRAPAFAHLTFDGQDVIADVHAVLTRMGEFAEQVRTGDVTGATGEIFTDVVNIGIGGSDLGPAMATLALRPYVHSSLRFHFVSNVDPSDLAATLAACDPARTLVLVASKTFTTAETMANAHAAREWLIAAMGEECIGDHMAAMSTALAATAAFGIRDERVFGFWDWVGGRYSVASAIGLALMIAIGRDRFAQFLEGMNQVDEHFRTQPLSRNVPALLGMLAVWNRNLLRIPSTAVLPYEQLLARFPAYLQQLTMESNGKSVMKDGSAVGVDTSAVFWGEPGTNGQHSFHQLLHQGTQAVACDVLAFANSATPIGHQHEMLLANALAQAEVLAVGRSTADLATTGCPQELLPHKNMPGRRPTTVMLAAQLDPRTLGALIAIYEHSVFTQGVLWGINSFDQWGVEFGKEVAVGLLPAVTGEDTTATLHPSTERSISLLRQLRH